MPKMLRTILMCLAVLAVGVVQVFGVQVGYLCGCTGQTTNLIVCQEEVCHPHADHDDEARCESAAIDGQSSESEGGEKFPREKEHKHSEIRESLVVTTSRSLPVLPVVVLFDLPMAFQLPETAMMMPELNPELVSSGPPEYGSPPIPLMVARTVVMMI